MKISQWPILLVEDAKVAQKAAYSVLSQFGFDIVLAPNGKEALVAFQKQKYALVFLDVGLPDMHGLKVAEKMREYDAKSEIKTPIIALTVHTSDEYQEAAIEYGMDLFLPKPLTKEQVEYVIKTYL
jgi:CheY-like chemotaxis protein